MTDTARPLNWSIGKRDLRTRPNRLDKRPHRGWIVKGLGDLCGIVVVNADGIIVDAGSAFWKWRGRAFKELRATHKVERVR